VVTYQPTRSVRCLKKPSVIGGKESKEGEENRGVYVCRAECVTAKKEEKTGTRKKETGVVGPAVRRKAA